MSFELNRSFVNRPRRALATIVALTTAIAGASVLTAVVNHHPSTGTAAPAVDLNAFPAVACAEAGNAAGSYSSEWALRHDEARLLRLFNESTSMPAEAIQVATFSEFHFEHASAGEIKEINIQSRSGDIAILHSQRPNVLVLGGKSATAQTYERAREYARQINITMKRDGEKVNVRITQPATNPDGVVGTARCMVLAPSGVKITTVSE